MEFYWYSGKFLKFYTFKFKRLCTNLMEIEFRWNWLKMCYVVNLIVLIKLFKTGYYYDILFSTSTVHSYVFNCTYVYFWVKSYKDSIALIAYHKSECLIIVSPLASHKSRCVYYQSLASRTSWCLIRRVWTTENSRKSVIKTVLRIDEEVERSRSGLLYIFNSRE